MSFRSRSMQEIASLGLPTPAGALEQVTDADLAPLPEPARRYLRFMGVVGRARDWSFRVGFKGRFRVRQGLPWRACEVWQYNSRVVVARAFHMRLRFGLVVPVVGRDTYLQGRGRLLIRLMDLVSVVDATGPEVDTGELVTYLNDLVLIAPSMLLAPDVSWKEVDSASFNLTLTDHGRAVSARVFVDERGAPVTFETTDRFCEDPSEPKKWMRARWSTPMQAFRSVEGRQVPTRGLAVWHLTQGDFAYADFELVADGLAYNVRPGK